MHLLMGIRRSGRGAEPLYPTVRTLFPFSGSTVTGPIRKVMSGREVS